MSSTDWVVLGITLLSIIFYGLWKSRGSKNIDDFFLADRQLPWYHIGLSVMATQASAITFISAPGLAYTDGLRFVQFYFGLPLAMVVLCITFVPMFRNLKVFTAYEYIEKRFDTRTRLLTAGLFLLQRGLSTGITIYAPAIILSIILGININYTIVLIGTLVIIYTVYGGARAVSYSQFFQMFVIFAGLFAAAFMVVHLLPAGVGFRDALHIAGKMGKLNAIDTKFDLSNRYNIWSGIIGGFFLQLSYFGTDQSQVGRYLTGRSIAQSRLGLILNGFIKIPMQFFILLIGTLVFSFYQFHPPPVFFNKTEVARMEIGNNKEAFHQLEADYRQANLEKQQYVSRMLDAVHSDKGLDEARTNLLQADEKARSIRKEAIQLISRDDPKTDTNDSNFIFLSFVTGFLPKGLIGLLIATIFLASMGSMASALNSLASTTLVDFYKRLFRQSGTDAFYLRASRMMTLAWGLLCISIAFYASRLGNLIEAVNILGSLFYGTILGIFLVAFYMKHIGGKAVFYAALVAEGFIITAWICNLCAFLWLNVIGCLLVMLLAAILQRHVPE